MTCECRKCGKHYDPEKSRADWKGYCSKRCQHAQAKLYGWRKGDSKKSEYAVLRDAGAIGEIPVLPVIAANGWPCHSFIREPIYRRLELARDVKITDKDVTIRLRTAPNEYTYVTMTWEEIVALKLVGVVRMAAMKKEVG